MGKDIRRFKAYRSRLPKEIFRKIFADVDKATTHGDFDFSMNRYHVAAKNFSKGIVNDPPCTNCRQGVAPETASLREFLISGSFDLHV